MLVEGFQERSRLKMMEERRFSTVDNHEAVNIGDLEKTVESLPVVKPNFATDMPGCCVKERMS